MLLNSCISQAGAPPERAITSANAHIMTPETATSTHYFYCNSRSYRTDDADYNSAFAANLGVAFQTEDKPMIEDQQRRMGGIDLPEVAVTVPLEISRRGYGSFGRGE
jgi:vanillate O-demethylase monooxygenase subunit